MVADRNPSELVTAAESLDYAPTTTAQDAAASRTTARHATGKDDLHELLAMLALPGGEDDLVALLPLIPPPAPDVGLPALDPIGDIMSVDAHLAVALSMYRSGYTLEQIHEASDMDPAELADHLTPQDHTDQGPRPAVVEAPATAHRLPAPPAAATPARFTADPADPGALPGAVALAVSMYRDGQPLDDITEATALTIDQIADAVAEHIDADAPILATPTDDVDQEPAEAPAAAAAVEPDSHEQLLAWAARHPEPRIRDLAAQARRSLDELAQLRGTEHDRARAQREVDRLRAALAEAEQRLHELQPAAPASPAAPVPLAAVPAPRSAPGTRVVAAGRIEPPADRRARQAIRTWANGHGYQVAPQGLISQTVLRAYADAHQSGLDRAS